MVGLSSFIMEMEQFHWNLLKQNHTVVQLNTRVLVTGRNRLAKISRGESCPSPNETYLTNNFIKSVVVRHNLYIQGDGCKVPSQPWHAEMDTIYYT
jgi:hypothetical protein